MRNSLLGLLLFCTVTSSALYQLHHSRRMCHFAGRIADCVSQRDDEAAHRVDHRAEEKRLAEERRDAEQRQRLEEARGSRQREFVPNPQDPSTTLHPRIRG